MKKSRIICIDSADKMVIDATDWLHKQLQLPENDSIDDYFCNYFNCTMLKESYSEGQIRTTLLFREPDAIVFKLDWSLTLELDL
jgi:uncharacterized protein YneR